MSLSVVAVIKAKPGKESDLEQLLHMLVQGTHEEPGCLTYALHRAQKETGTFIFVEKWKTQADLAAHFETPHIKEALRRKPELISQMDVYSLDPIGSGDLSKSSF